MEVYYMGPRSNNMLGVVARVGEKDSSRSNSVLIHRNNNNVKNLQQQDHNQPHLQDQRFLISKGPLFGSHRDTGIRIDDRQPARADSKSKYKTLRENETRVP